MDKRKITKALISRYPISEMELLGFELFDNKAGRHIFTSDDLIVVWDSDFKCYNCFKQTKKVLI